MKTSYRVTYLIEALKTHGHGFCHAGTLTILPFNRGRNAEIPERDGNCFILWMLLKKLAAHTFQQQGDIASSNKRVFDRGHFEYALLGYRFTTDNFVIRGRPRSVN